MSTGPALRAHQVQRQQHQLDLELRRRGLEMGPAALLFRTCSTCYAELAERFEKQNQGAVELQTIAAKINGSIASLDSDSRDYRKTAKEVSEGLAQSTRLMREAAQLLREWEEFPAGALLVEELIPLLIRLAREDEGRFLELVHQADGLAAEGLCSVTGLQPESVPTPFWLEVLRSEALRS